MDWQEIIPELRKYFTEFGIHIISALVVLVIGFWISKIITKIFRKVLLNRDVDLTLIEFLTSASKFALYFIVIIAAVSQLGIETTSLIAALGAAGLAIGLALQGSLANLAAGVMLIIFRQIKVGQTVEAGVVTGVVEKVGVFNTTLVSFDNKVIYIPNSKLINDNIINYSEKDVRRIDLVFGISYSDNIEKAKNSVLELLNTHPKVLKDPVPFVAVGELGDSSVNLIVRPWVKNQDFFGVKVELIEMIKQKFDELNITIPFPQRDVYLFNKNN